MSEPADRVMPPLPEDDPSMLRRAPFAVLGVAGLVVSTVFAAVATFAASPKNQAQPLPYKPGLAWESTAPGPRTSTPASAPIGGAPPVSSTINQPTTSTSQSRGTAPTTTTESSTVAQPPPPPPPAQPQPKPPVARFSSTCPSGGLVCQFNGSTSADPDGMVIYYAWSFGDNKTAEGPRPSHTYAAPGSYTVTLLVMDNSGKTDTIQHPVTVNGAGPG